MPKLAHARPHNALHFTSIHFSSLNQGTLPTSFNSCKVKEVELATHYSSKWHDWIILSMCVQDLTPMPTSTARPFQMVHIAINFHNILTGFGKTSICRFHQNLKFCFIYTLFMLSWHIRIWITWEDMPHRYMYRWVASPWTTVVKNCWVCRCRNMCTVSSQPTNYNGEQLLGLWMYKLVQVSLVTYVRQEVIS